MKTKLFFSVLAFVLTMVFPAQAQLLNNFEAGAPEVTATYGAVFNVVANPQIDGNNATAHCGEIKRTSGNWYEIVRFATSFNVPANQTKYIHMLVRYTSAVVPNMSVRVDAAADNDGNTELHPVNTYNAPGMWKDMVFEVNGGTNGFAATQFLFFADASVNVLNSTTSFAYIDEIVLNDNPVPADYQEDMMLNDFEAGAPAVWASYGAAYANVDNPLMNEVNTTAHCGEIKRTGGAWYELVRFATYFNVPANTTKYIHVLVKYTSAVVPNMSVRIDATADNDGTTDIHPTQDYTTVGQWQDMVFEIPGGDTGITPSQFLFFADAAVNVLNNTDSFAYIDQILINNTATPSTVAGVKETTAGSLKVYPNPAQAHWDFQLQDAQGVSMLEIVDVLGKTVIRQEVSSANVRVDATALLAGIYFARIASGKQVTTLKLIKS